MIVVKPMSGQTKIKVTGLYQWDQLRTLQFADEYPSGTEVHFAIKGESVALVYLLENGVVRIPSVLLQRACPIMAWVHVGEATVLEIEMPVTPRSMPSDYVGIEDETQHSIEYRMIKLEQWQVEAINQMSDRYTKTETDQKLNLKADAKRVYTKVEANTLLNEKADVNTVDDGLSDRYTKDETDGLLAGKVDLADSLTLNNLVVNGDFSQGTTDWAALASTISVTGGILKIVNGAGSLGSAYQNKLVVGAKNYVRVKWRKITPNVVNLLIRDTSTTALAASPSNTDFGFDSVVITALTTQLRLGLYTSVSASPEEIEIDHVILINLTQTFGAGNEPTKAEMDKLIDMIGWFDGEITVPQKTLAIWTLNLIRQNRNAIIELGGTII